MRRACRASRRVPVLGSVCVEAALLHSVAAASWAHHTHSHSTAAPLPTALSAPSATAHFAPSLPLPLPRSGTAKTLIANQYLEAFDSEAHVTKTINFSSATTPFILQKTVEGAFFRDFEALPSLPACSAALG